MEVKMKWRDMVSKPLWRCGDISILCMGEEEEEEVDEGVEMRIWDVNGWVPHA